MLRESSGSTEEAENMMTRALQVITEHSQLRANTSSDDIVIDEVDTNISISFSFICHLHRKTVEREDIIYVEKMRSRR